jgi:transcriptional regulator with XRE-family HTH domain
MERMRQLREEKGLSQAQAAVRAGMDPSTWNRLEQGKGNPNLKTLERVADALGVEVADLLGKAERRSPLEPSLLNSLEDERRTSVLADAIVAAAETWLAAVSNPDINIHKRFGFRDAAIELFDRINERIIHGKMKTLGPEERSDIVAALGKLNEIPEAAYEAMPDETLKEAHEERKKKMLEWTREISASA